MLGHITPMQTTLPRIIAHIFLLDDLPAQEVDHLKNRMAETCRAQGRELVAIIVDRGPPKADPAEHLSLRRIAYDDADELIVLQIPISIPPRKSPDVLLSQLDRPVQIFSTKQLACRGLFLDGSTYTPRRTLADAADLARALRADGKTFNAIACRLNAACYQTARRRKWYPSTVFKLLARTARKSARAATERSPRQ